MLLQDVDRISSQVSAGEHAAQRLLVAFDGSPGAWAALDRAIALAVTANAKLTIAAVAQLPHMCWGAPGGVTLPYTYSSLKREVEGEMLRCLAEARDEVPATVPVETRLLHGKPACALARLAQAGHFDLLVTGPRPEGRLRRFFGGSVTHALLSRCGISVLAVRAPEA